DVPAALDGDADLIRVHACLAIVQAARTCRAHIAPRTTQRNDLVHVGPLETSLEDVVANVEIALIHIRPDAGAHVPDDEMPGGIARAPLGGMVAGVVESQAGVRVL